MTAKPKHKFRVRRTTDEKPPPASAPEGRRAAWWREHLLKMSRPQLAARLGVHESMLYRQERAARRRKFADEQLALHFNTHDQKESGHEYIIDAIADSP